MTNFRLVSEQEFYRSCMSDRGFVYEIPPISQVEVRDEVYVASWWTMPDSKLAKSEGFGVAVPFNEEPSPFVSNTYEALTPEGKVEYNSALDGCIGSAASTGQFDEPLNPLGVDLESQFLGALTKASLDLPFDAINRSYKSCIADHGFMFESPYDAGDAAEVELGRVGYYNVDPRSSEYAKLLPRAQEAERNVALADAECRQKLTDDAAEILMPIATSWVDGHALEIGQARNIWDG